MKLYTEEEVKTAIDLAHNGLDGYYDIITKLTPIELPSDEEIDSKYGERITMYDLGFTDGAKSMRDKILNQNK